MVRGYDLIRPLLFRLPPETAHHIALTTLQTAQSYPQTRRLLQHVYQYRDSRLEVDVFNQTFPAPVGVAAGFDKNARVPRALTDLGFGFVEIGTVTPAPQAGNPQPRLFRLPADNALINRLGFNGDGVDRVHNRLASTSPIDVPIGVNIGKMNTSGQSAALSDYETVATRLHPYADYLTVNVSCPNTPDRFDEQDPEYIRRLTTRVRDVVPAQTPVLVKLGPDTTYEGVEAVVDLLDETIDGYIATNTTKRRSLVASPKRTEQGGLSGKPLERDATHVVRWVASLSDNPIIGVGGVDSAASAYRKIRAGASLVQLYTGLVYEGPSIARQINKGLVTLLEQDGFDCLEEAIGAGLD